MIEAEYSPAIADAILTPPGLASGGVYTSVGVYEFREFTQLVERLSSLVGQTRSAILVQFGRFHFHRLFRLYPHMVAGVTDTFGLLARVGVSIHATIARLHTNAEVPEISFTKESATRARLEYHSPRALADVAEGLILAAIVHFKESIHVERVDYPDDTGCPGGNACFILTINPLH
jgi:hypothetical protein